MSTIKASTKKITSCEAAIRVYTAVKESIGKIYEDLLKCSVYLDKRKKNMTTILEKAEIRNHGIACKVFRDLTTIYKRELSDLELFEAESIGLARRGERCYVRWAPLQSVAQSFFDLSPCLLHFLVGI